MRRLFHLPIVRHLQEQSRGIERSPTLEIDRAIFCGQSLGGITGLWLGVHRPQRLLGLMLVNTAPNFPKDVWVERCAIARADGIASLVEPTLARWFTADFAVAHPDEVDAIRRIIGATPPEGYAACGEALCGADLAPRMSEIDLPVRIIAGRYDPATPPERSEEIARAVAGAELVTLECAHLAPVEAAKPFGALLKDFVTRHANGQGHAGGAH